MVDLKYDFNFSAINSDNAIVKLIVYLNLKMDFLLFYGFLLIIMIVSGYVINRVLQDPPLAWVYTLFGVMLLAIPLFYLGVVVEVTTIHAEALLFIAVLFSGSLAALYYDRTDKT